MFCREKTRRLRERRAGAERGQRIGAGGVPERKNAKRRRSVRAKCKNKVGDVMCAGEKNLPYLSVADRTLPRQVPGTGLWRTRFVFPRRCGPILGSCGVTW